MLLSRGDLLGPYQVLDFIGQGGMGKVYRARDTRLHRDVAIKVSGERFTERFEREARAIASLNHPNICTLFDVGPNYLVMELIEGPTLADRIRRGAIPADEALSLCGQIADALAAAHEKGVIHRDLKPANVKIRPDGAVKVLDFGLAKAGGAVVEADENSPTRTMEETRPGVVLGTAAYMSPEQAKGKQVDKRADIWAFGVVLYEMLTGERLHKGETISEIIAGVLKETPDWRRIPSRFRPLLKACLQKDAHARLHDIEDARFLLEAAGETAPARTLWRWIWPAVALVAIAVAAFAMLRGLPVSDGEERVSEIVKPDDLTFNPGSQAAISPDSKMLAYVAMGPDDVSRVYLRNLKSKEVKVVPGLERVFGASPPPVWSPDGRYLFFGWGDGKSGRLIRFDLEREITETIASTGQSLVQGITINDAGTIIYANNSDVLMKIPPGGAPIRLTQLAPGEVAHRWPEFLPDGKRYLYQRVSGTQGKTGIYVRSLDAKLEDPDTLLVNTDRQVKWFTTKEGESYLLIQDGETLRARPFNPETAAFIGDRSVIVAQGVGSYPAATAGMWSVARNGDLTYRNGGAELPHLTLRGGRWREEAQGEPENIANPAFSPDGKGVVFAKKAGQGGHLYLRDLEHLDKPDRQLTFKEGLLETSPQWNPKRGTIIFAAQREGRPNLDLYEMNPDGTAPKLLYASGEDKTPTSVSSDGQYLLFHARNDKTGFDIWGLRLDHPLNAKPFCVLRTEYNELWAEFSPSNSRWIAYTSMSGPSSQIFAREISLESECTTDVAGSRQISQRSGLYPEWDREGKKIYYVDLDFGFQEVNVSGGAPHRLGTIFLIQSFSVSRTGPERFVTVESPPGPPFVTLQTDWMSRLKQ